MRFSYSVLSIHDSCSFLTEVWFCQMISIEIYSTNPEKLTKQSISVYCHSILWMTCSCFQRILWDGEVLPWKTFCNFEFGKKMYFSCDIPILSNKNKILWKEKVMKFPQNLFLEHWHAEYPDKFLLSEILKFWNFFDKKNRQIEVTSGTMSENLKSQKFNFWKTTKLWIWIFVSKLMNNS